MLKTAVFRCCCLASMLEVMCLSAVLFYLYTFVPSIAVYMNKKMLLWNILFFSIYLIFDYLGLRLVKNLQQEKPVDDYKAPALKIFTVIIIGLHLYVSIEFLSRIAGSIHTLGRINPFTSLKTFTVCFMFIGPCINFLITPVQIALIYPLLKRLKEKRNLEDRFLEEIGT